MKSIKVELYLYTYLAKLMSCIVLLIKASIYICPSGLLIEMRAHVNASIVATAAAAAPNDLIDFFYLRYFNFISVGSLPLSCLED